MKKRYLPALALSLLLFPGVRPACAQPTASRLLAITNYTGDMTQLLQSDSILYKYSSGFTNTVAETNSFEWYGGKTAPRLNNFHTYNANGILVAREWHMWDNGTKSWKKKGKIFFTIDAKGNVLKETQLGWNAAASAYQDSTSFTTYTLDAAGNRLSELQTYWDNPSQSWRDAVRTTRTFNAQGSILTEGAESNGTSGWKVSMAHHYSYDASGKNMLSDTTLAPDPATPGARMRIGIQTFVLNSSGKPLGTTSWTWNANNKVYDSSRRSVYAYDAAGNMTRETSYIKYTNQAFRNYFQDDYTYNSFRQPTKYTRFFWGTAAFDYLSIYRLYYYGSYIPASVSGTASTTPALTVSPNPAVEGMRVQVQGIGEFTALLMDMQGRVHQKFSGNANGGFEEYISVSAMPAGTYLLKVAGSAGSTAQLVTVQH